MMNVNSLWSGFASGLALHSFFAFLVFIAAVLFVVWMVKFAKKEDMMNWIIGLLVVGLLGCIITFFLFRSHSWQKPWENEVPNSLDYTQVMMDSEATIPVTNMMNADER